MTIQTKTPKAVKPAKIAPPPSFEAFNISAPAMEVPAAFRDFAEKGIAQARDTYAKMKTAAVALTAAEQQLKKAKELAQPRDVADIVVCEPFTVRVLPAEKK